jgi:hypothetical protein
VNAVGRLGVARLCDLAHFAQSAENGVEVPRRSRT